MKIKCITKTLKESLGRAENFIGKDLDLPVLSCILLETKNNFLEISATNINTSFQSNISVNVLEDGKVAVLGDVLAKTIANIESDEVELVLENNILKIISDKNNLELNTVDYSDFPTILKSEDVDEELLEFNFSVKKFLAGINSVIYATSKSSIKPELASVALNSHENILDFAATDGFRLAEKSFKLEDNSSEFKMLIPNDSASLIAKSLTNLNDDKINILYFGKQFFIKTHDFTIFSRLTDGDFVDYKKLIPESGEVSLIFLKQDFLNLSKIINIFSDDFNQLKISVKDKRVEVETKNKYGKNISVLDAVIDGGDIEMSFNHKNILDSFNSIDTDSVEFLFNNGRPLLIRGVGDRSFKYIVMPLSK